MIDKQSSLEPSRSWHERHEGITTFSVTSDGMTGTDWIARLENQGFPIGYYTKSVLRSPDFKPTAGVTTEIVVLWGGFFGDDDSSINQVYTFAARNDLVVPDVEVACLIREKFSNREIEEMGFDSLLVMHRPINDADGVPVLLQVARRDCGGYELTYYNVAGMKWQPDGYGFVFRRGEPSERLFGL